MSYLKKNGTKDKKDKKSKMYKKARKRARDLHVRLEKQKQIARKGEKTEEKEVVSEKNKTHDITTALAAALLTISVSDEAQSAQTAHTAQNTQAAQIDVRRPLFLKAPPLVS